MTEQILAGWKQIADVVGRSIATCQRWAKRTGDLRLPVYRYMGEARLDLADFAKWQHKWKAAMDETRRAA